MIAERVFRATIHAFCLGILAVAVAHAAPVKSPPQPLSQLPETAKTAIASAHPLATAAGFEVLDAGGNAFDAAIAITATLAVVEPFSAGLGGGGLFLLHDVKRKETVLVDAQEVAPGSSVPDMYRNAKGEFVEDWALNGPLAAAIPGTPAAIVHLAARYGKLPLATSLRPAIRIAREGFPVDERYRQVAKTRLEVLRRFVGTSSLFLFKADVPALGTLVRQPDLADTLDAIARGGHDGFYRGPVAARLVDAVVEEGGIWTTEDLARYAIVERPPLVGEYRGARILSAPPPSAGGIVLLQTLQVLEALDYSKVEGAGRDHLLVEALRQVMLDALPHLGDPAFHPQSTQVPSLAVGQAGKIADSIRRATGKPLPLRGDGQMAMPEADGASHFAVLDREGNRVSATLGLNQPFGSGFAAKGVGILLNNRMATFASGGGENRSGTEGVSAPNSIAPGKRPLSFAAPTFVEYNDRIALLGGAGGSRIPGMLAQQLMGLLEVRSPSAVLADPRFNPAYPFEYMECEPEYFGGKSAIKLRARGHVIRSTGRPYGNSQLVLWERSGAQASAASDPRGAGSAAAR